MSIFKNLKNTIATNIRANGTGEITGQILQESLINIINELGNGMQFFGIANPTTNPGHPDNPRFYIATNSGEYSNFLNSDNTPLTLEKDSIYILSFKNGYWESQNIAENIGGSASPELETKIQELESKLNEQLQELESGINTKLTDLEKEATTEYKGLMSAEDKKKLDAIEKSNSVEIINDLSTGGKDKALSAEMGKEIWDSVSAVIELSRDITSKFSMIQGKQAYGNVGQIINVGDLSGAEYTVIDIEGVYVSFKSLPGDTRISSYLQYTNSDDVIVARKFENIGNNIKCEEFIEFPEGATKCYITVATGTLSVVKKEKEGELTKRVNSMEPSVNKYLINKTSTMDVVEDVTSEYTITKGSQAYGNVGSAISIGIQSILEYVVIDTEGVIVEFMSEERAIGVSSYLQYVDSNGIIIERDFINIGVGVACKTTIIFPEGAVRAYVTGNKGTIQIFKSSSVLVSQFEGIKHKMDNLPTVGKLEDITIADNPDSIVDAINKGCTLSMGGTLILNKQEIFDKWGITSANNMFIAGTVGSKISLLKGQDVRNIKIPVKDGDIITYPMFKTSQINGSFLIDNNNIVLEAFINNTKPDGTLGTVEVNGYGSKEVYFYMSLYPYSLITQSIIIKNANSEYAEIPINKYLLELLSNDYKSNVSENKALTTIGALRLYEELSDKIKGNNLLLFPCKDYGVMPSCLHGDSGAFLQDGVDSGGNAIIKYADVIAKYDELVTAYPNYVKKKELGFDASGTIPMYAYTLEPKYPTQSIYLQAGVHGWEPDPVFALAMITTLIANAYGTTNGDGLKVDDNALKFIRENVKITIVPCVNPYGFNNRADCGIDKRAQAQNNANGVNLNSAWNGNAAEAVAVRTLIESIKDELSFAIDMHSTVWEDSRSRYGCFYGGVNGGSASLLTAFKTYEWLYKFYNIKYPSIVQGDSVPNPLGNGYASIGTMTGTFNSWIYSTYGIESTTMEFSDHVWTSELHTSVAMSVAVNMYLNQFIQHICARFKTITPKVESVDIYPAKG